ncbi:serine/threonine protein kinase [Kitasatospora sp. NBC_00070]|uniref:serine/threonine-protein kinase n=1 Tax=Kitasatospora sp. NBC_00070 TaxID=2975962 RepID=UPI0032543FAB
MRAGDVLDGKYRLVEEIGRGGFGVVWRSVDTRLGREIAVKVISDSAELGAVDIARFRHEARAVAKLNHPHIVTLHDIGETATGSPYLVMELVQGRSLAAVVKQARPGLPQVLDWLGQVCVALAAAHRADVVHRDIKPENIMITEAGHAKVLDFGIARLDGRPGGLTTIGTVIGSPIYLAPERWADGPVDGRVDLYAVGCMLYELSVGQRPFNAGTVVGLMRQHVDVDPPRPRQVAPELPLALERLILDLLAKDPADRPADGLEVARRLAEIQPGRAAELRARADAAWALGAAGSPTEAARRLWPLIGEFARECGAHDPRTLRTCHDLALWLAADGRVPEAVGLLGELLATGVGGGQAEDAARDLARLTARLPPRAAPVTGQLALLVG